MLLVIVKLFQEKTDYVLANRLKTKDTSCAQVRQKYINLVNLTFSSQLDAYDTPVFLFELDNSRQIFKKLYLKTKLTLLCLTTTTVTYASTSAFNLKNCLD